MGKEAFLSKDGNKVKLEYVKDGHAVSTLWERRDSGLLETAFDSDGLVLFQKLVKSDDKYIDHKVKETLHGAKISKLSEKKYSDVKINRRCPGCGESGLSRYVDAFASSNDIPVIPIYYCANCKSKSYSLTDHYLEYLVESNRGLFEESEANELQRNRDATLGEIRGYIIRMFASKKILCIK